MAKRPMSWRRQVRRLAILLVVAYVGVVLVFAFLQRHFVYFPQSDLEETPDEYGLRYEDVTLMTDDGVQIHGWYVSARKPRGAVLFFHGNAGNISHRIDSLKVFADLDLDCLIVDYRGYGRSEGTPSEEGTYRDAKAGWDYLTAVRKWSPDKIVIFGRSLGGAVATELATRVHPAALIVESTFTSAPDMAALMLPIFPARWLCRFDYNTVDRIGAVDCPVLVVHSPDDDLIPYELGRRVFDAAGEPKEFFEIQGGHNEGFLLDVIRYSEALNRFISKNLATAAGGEDK